MPTVKLTKTGIDDLKPQATDQVCWDRTLRGLGVKVTPAGRRVFVLMYGTLAQWSKRQISDITRADVRECSEVIIQRGALPWRAGPSR